MTDEEKTEILMLRVWIPIPHRECICRKQGILRVLRCRPIA